MCQVRELAGAVCYYSMARVNRCNVNGPESQSIISELRTILMVTVYTCSLTTNNYLAVVVGKYLSSSPSHVVDLAQPTQLTVSSIFVNTCEFLLAAEDLCRHYRTNILEALLSIYLVYTVLSLFT